MLEDFFTLPSAFKPVSKGLNTRNAANAIRDFKGWIIEREQKIKLASDSHFIQNQDLKSKDDCLETNSISSEFKTGLQQKGYLDKSGKQLQKLKQFTLDIQHQILPEQKNATTQYKTRRLRNKIPLKYDCQSDTQNQAKENKRCETKNIIKNFIRSVLSYLRKYQNFQSKVLKHLQIDPFDFVVFLQQIQGKINTISQLRQIWTNHKYHKAFRLISEHFLRKYYTKHIFHSRIFNHQIHLKYRIKLLKSLQNPEQFTSLKDY